MKVSLFIPCLVDSLYPEVGEAMVQVFRKLGISMTYPSGQTCCGQPAFNAGYRKEARLAAKRFIQLFEYAEVIVCPSGSCVNMVKNHYLELFRGDENWYPRAQAISEKVHEFSQYLIDVLAVDDVGAAYPAKVTYHDSCHLLRGLRVKDQPRSLIRKVKGVTFIEMQDSERCCGFGGAFAFKYPEISAAILKEKVRNIVISGANFVIGCDMGCLMNIQGMLSRQKYDVKTLHIAQLLAS